MTHIRTQTDAQLQQQILKELSRDARVKQTDVGVEVNNGVVTLNGTLETWSARVAAQEAAHRVEGVLDVANDICVKPHGSLERSDTEIAQAVRHTLEWDVLVPDERIRTTVSGGVVTLEGTVDFWTEHEDIARAVRNLAGVCEVRNLVAVEPPNVPPESLKAAIDEALMRHAEHAARHVKVEVEEGRVTLSGDVPSWAERNAIIGAVKGTPGVRRIQNELHVRS